ncbi:M9 family metallopeptidase [Vibrio bivalvicida]|uniref:microbial collagenase n=1 Tax=Vibrio bivalvicida TaxID=1276888 RepID=A0A177Y362_9VIBR|nr:M9 family metallopeptidase [Vibrio bivalvicida]OAJ94925.1 peptidase M9 [Vibrio bivalvicida]
MKQRQWALGKLAGACLLTGLSGYAQASPQCEFNDLSQGNLLVESIASAQSSCYQSWFNAPAEAAVSLYSEASLNQVVGTLSAEVNQYRGEDAQAIRIANLSEFIKAAYFARYGTQEQYGYFSDEFSRTIAQISDRFIRSKYAIDLGREQVRAMSSMTLLVDSVKQLQLTMDSMLILLESFDRENSKNLQYVDGLNNLFRAMNGHIVRDAFYNELVQHPQYLYRLKQFVDSNLWTLGTDSEFLVYNAVRETGRLLAGRNDSLNQQVMPFLESIMAQHKVGTEGEKLWLASAEMLLFYAPEKAKELNIEGKKQQLERRLLVNRYECSGPAIIRSQNLTQQQSQQACEILSSTEADFHRVANTGQAPVKDDLNNNVEVVVWQDNDSYTTYSNFLFGNSTDNGGQYLEGNPSDENNVARFLAYRYASEELSILNLEHEYIHYLDGRFNLYGGFSKTLSEGNIVWWLEGFAEYMHYKNGYQAAVDLTGDKHYSLAEIFATTYDHDLNRVYRWGYLAVRFLLEQHPSEVDRILQYARSGDYSAWSREVKLLGSELNTEFATWLDSVSVESHTGDGSEGDSGSIETPQSQTFESIGLNRLHSFSAEDYQERLFYVDVPNGVSEFSVSITGDGDADLYASYEKVAHYYDYQMSEFQRGSEETIEFEAQSNGLIAPGRYYFSLAAREAFQNVEVVTFAKKQIQTHKPKDDLSPLLIENNKAKSLTVNERRYIGLYVEQPGTVRVWLTPKQQDQGKVDMYVGLEAWASESQYDLSTTSQGKYQYLEFNVDKTGYIHFTLATSHADSEIELFASY